MMQVVRNILLEDRHGKPIATDIHFKNDGGARPVIIYAHGFNGFKDWGGFELLAARFVEAGFTLVKFNFAFNGTRPETPEAFTDLEAFAANNYTIELDNLSAVIDWVADPENPYAAHIAADKIALCGHSMGGGIVLIKASEDRRVRAVATWASVSECKTPWGSWPAAKIEGWQKEGMVYIENGRTKQQMPLGFQLYEDFQQNAGRLSIEAAIKRLGIPILLVHGKSDTSVPSDRAAQLKEWQPGAELYLTDGDHTFNRRHPWVELDLPPATQAVLEKTISFVRHALGQ